MSNSEIRYQATRIVGALTGACLMAVTYMPWISMGLVRLVY